MNFDSGDFNKLERKLIKLKIPKELRHAILWIASDVLDYAGSQNGIAENALETVKDTIKEIQKYQKTIKAYRDAIHELEWDEVTGGCVSNCGGDSIEGHEEDCPYILVLQKYKLIDVVKG